MKDIWITASSVVSISRGGIEFAFGNSDGNGRGLPGSIFWGVGARLHCYAVVIHVGLRTRHLLCLGKSVEGGRSSVNQVCAELAVDVLYTGILIYQQTRCLKAQKIGFLGEALMCPL